MQRDFDQFSKFLRGPHRYTTCNSEAGGTGAQNPPQQMQPQAPQNRPLAMVYAVKQDWNDIYDPEIALMNGTIFRELDKPFEMSGCSKNSRCQGNERGIR